MATGKNTNNNKKTVSETGIRNFGPKAPRPTVLLLLLSLDRKRESSHGDEERMDKFKRPPSRWD